MPDGYSIYISVRHGVLLSLGNHRRRLQGRDSGVPALAQFLPRISTVEQSSTPALQPLFHPTQDASQTEKSLDMVESFGVLARIIHSPSFHKRWRDSIETPINKECLLNAGDPQPCPREGYSQLIVRSVKSNLTKQTLTDVKLKTLMEWMSAPNLAEIGWSFPCHLIKINAGEMDGVRIHWKRFLP